MEPYESLCFSVEMWSLDGTRWDEVMARASNVALAHAAFDAAVIERPNARIRLRDGTRLIRDTHPTVGKPVELQPRSRGG